MRFLVRSFQAILVMIGIGVLHYTLPQNDVVRINDTYEKRIDFGRTGLFWARHSGEDGRPQSNRDVFFIESFDAQDRPIVFRNEDTGWGWPFYFKFDTSNLQAEASNLRSAKSSAQVQWVKIRHYGWRNTFLSIYPNAVSLKPVSGPDETSFPWFNTVFLTLLGLAFWALRVRWLRFYARRLSPISDALEERLSDFWAWVRSFRKT